MDNITFLLFDRISNIFYKKLSNISIESNINCDIAFKNVNVNLGKNCNVRMVNKCVANASVSFRLLLESIQESLSFMSEYEKKIIKEKLGITEDTVIDEKLEFLYYPEPNIVTKCKAYADVDNSIYVYDLDIGHCESDVPLYFEFINAGSATANCGFKELTTVMIEEMNKNREKNTEKKRKLLSIFNIRVTDWTFVLLPLLFLILLSIILVFYIYIFKRFKIIFYSKNDIIPKNIIDYSIGLVGLRNNNIKYFS